MFIELGSAVEWNLS